MATKKRRIGKAKPRKRTAAKRTPAPGYTVGTKRIRRRKLNGTRRPVKRRTRRIGNPMKKITSQLMNGAAAFAGGAAAPLATEQMPADWGANRHFGTAALGLALTMFDKTGAIGAAGLGMIGAAGSGYSQESDLFGSSDAPAVNGPKDRKFLKAIRNKMRGIAQDRTVITGIADDRQVITGNRAPSHYDKTHEVFGRF